MRRRQIPAVVTIMLAACGGSDPGLDIGVSISRQIVWDTGSIGLFNFDDSCELLRLSGIDAAIYDEPIIAGTSMVEFAEIFPANYRIAVFLEQGDRLTGYGCDESGLEVENGQHTLRTIYVCAPGRTDCRPDPL